MSLTITPSGASCGASITGIDLSKPLDSDQLVQLRNAWMAHHVLSLPDQQLTADQLEAFTAQLGRLAEEPFFTPIEGQRYTAKVARSATETTSIFAEAWHADWTFEQRPPVGTCLYGVTIPPHGGDTLFANQHAAYQALPGELRNTVDQLEAIHSAVMAYSPEGIYGQEPADSGRAMQPVISDKARERCTHPLVMTHPENGHKAIYGTLGYIIGITGYSDQQALELLTELQTWQTREEHIYRHQWQPNMLVIWDNRSVLHCATGGYEGYDRLLLRTTVWPA